MTAEQSQIWDRVVAAMRAPLQEYAQLVRGLYAGQAKAVVLFGEVLGSEFDRARDTARSVVVVESVDLPTLRRLADQGIRLGKAAIAAPLIMTLRYLESSLDTFPLELIEIQQRHVTVFGEEFFAGLTFEVSHVRLQCEREFKRTLIHLRQGLLATAGMERHVPRLAHDAAEGLLRTLRGMLWLAGRKEFLPTGDVLTEVEKLAERRLPAWRTALDHSKTPGWREFDELYREVEGLKELADAGLR